MSTIKMIDTASMWCCHGISNVGMDVEMHLKLRRGTAEMIYTTWPNSKYLYMEHEYQCVHRLVWSHGVGIQTGKFLAICFPNFFLGLLEIFSKEVDQSEFRSPNENINYHHTLYMQ